MKIFKKQQGFTLIELLIVIVIIVILAVTVFVALNPVKRIRDAQDARRVTDVENILTAIHEYVTDNKGNLPTGLSLGMSEVQLGTDTSGCTVSSGGCSVTTSSCLDMAPPLAKYLKSMPYDPKIGSAGKTYYSVVVNGDGIVTVRACGAESITVSQSR